MVDKSEVTTVSLLLQMVRPEDGGEWECRPDNAPPASVRLHVIKGEMNKCELKAADSIIVKLRVISQLLFTRR